MEFTEKCLKSEKVFAGKLLKVWRDEVLLPDGREEVREVIHHSGAAVIVPILDDGDFILIKQFRYALGEVTIEFPAGKLEFGEDPLTCARRELEEETGYLADDWQELFQLHPAPGYSDERLWIFLARNLHAGKEKFDADEIVESVRMSQDDLWKRLRNGEITDAKTVAAICFLKCAYFSDSH